VIVDIWSLKNVVWNPSWNLCKIALTPPWSALVALTADQRNSPHTDVHSVSSHVILDRCCDIVCFAGMFLDVDDSMPDEDSIVYQSSVRGRDGKAVSSISN
jgi:hypothetical protein